MKKLGILLRIAVCALLVLSGVGVIAVAGWQLVSGDWKLFENDIWALIQIFAKILLSVYCIGIALKAIYQKKGACLWTAVRLFAVSLVAAPFPSNHLGWLFVLPAFLFLLLQPDIWHFLLERYRIHCK